ncbi:MAG: glutamate--tRNA ligase [Deltaproteobacteria bacterium]|nr:glutamate--tRNA ligase [Deltaproteobacteria bacterium]MBW1934272.1 glutamate--tRNA ligase [Deltaproteobacteria bacterium]MBW1977503.1 glutamate--tRNA ligase [Deltaproteobacteria bacterium]MBW2043930.1 glutamate--tRNA ligase [Deltaproteobacteria bacterium]MBW2299604.1 glutamate--tRNA ligase [Deltaproteobacteria bacterium]
MDNKKVVTRFPPSPTGYLHIGGARTALFNWLFARKHKGKFILRIEDTDQARSSEEATNAILESLRWLGLDWDEGPYFQSRRYHIYREYLEKLLASGKAYYCHCTPQELEERRKQAMAKGLKPKYDGKCRNLGLGPAPHAVVRLKAPQTGKTSFNDLVKGPISFNNEELDDLVLWRSDGNPTYHLAVVVDDITMGLTHIIRGDDHVNNTPRQIMIYQALGEPLPYYAHVPMILGPDRTRLSKRHGATSVLAYRDMGYLPQAVLNALARLGWSYGDQEKFSIDELIEKFSLEHVGKSPGIFNAEKLLDLNAQYIRESDTGYLTRTVIPFLEKRGLKNLDETKVARAVETLKIRSKTLDEMAEGSLFYFQDEISYEEKADRKFLKPNILGLMEEILERLEKTEVFSQKSLEKVFLDFIEEKQIKLGKIAQPLRVALTGKSASPGLFEVMEILGKEKVLERIRKALTHIARKT